MKPTIRFGVACTLALLVLRANAQQALPVQLQVGAPESDVPVAIDWLVLVMSESAIHRHYHHRRAARGPSTRKLTDPVDRSRSRI